MGPSNPVARATARSLIPGGSLPASLLAEASRQRHLHARPFIQLAQKQASKRPRAVPGAARSNAVTWPRSRKAAGCRLCARRRGSRPVSRVLSRAIIPLRSTSPWTSSGLPGSARGSALRALLPEPAASLFGLAPGGVCHASLVTKAAVRSYRTVSPLPSRAACAARSWAVCFLLHFPWARAPQALPGT